MTSQDRKGVRLLRIDDQHAIEQGDPIPEVRGKWLRVRPRRSEPQADRSVPTRTGDSGNTGSPRW